MDLLAELVSIPSMSGEERRLAERIEALMTERGFSTRRLAIAPGRFNILAERSGSGKPIGLYGHMDTVEPADGWVDPFRLTESGDRLIGLGAWDMKGGLAAIIDAVGKRTERPIKAAFGVDEENVSEGAYAIVKSGFFDTCGCIVSTDTGADDGEHSGERQITLGRLGRAVYEFNGDMPIERINMKKRGIFPSAPPSVHGNEIEWHLTPPETPESVLAELNGIGSARLKERKTPYLLPQLTDRNDPSVRRLEGIINAELGRPRIAYGDSVADENVLALSGIPVITYGPRGANMHSAGEWVSKKSCLNIAMVLRGFLNGAGGERSDCR